jgi:spore maturation protein SpmA
LNFAANFWDWNSAATYSVESDGSRLQNLIEKDKASDFAQIMFMHALQVCLLIPTSIIGYRAENAANPADVMLPCITTSFIGTIATFERVGIKQKSILKCFFGVALMTIIAAIVGLLFYVNGLDLVGKDYFTSFSGLMLVAR